MLAVAARARLVASSRQMAPTAALAFSTAPHDRKPRSAPKSTSVAAEVVRALVAAVERSGTSRAAFLGAIGLTEADLDVEQSRLPLDAVLRYCEQALIVSGDPALGLHWGAAFDPRDFAPVSHLVGQAGNLRRGLELAMHYTRLLHDRRGYEVVEDETHAMIRMSKLAVSPSVTRFRAEMALSRMLTFVQHVSARAEPVAVRFAYPAPAYRSEYERVFGAVVEFDQPETELVFERALLDAPSRHFDLDVQAALTTVAERRLDRLSRRATRAARHLSWALRIREYLLERAPARLTMEATASAFGQSARTLRRQLAAEGTTYRDVEYAALASTAGRLLCDEGCSIQETAHEMGFSDVGSFHRAFKTWAGVTPNEYRDKASEAPGPEGKGSKRG
jgi:AraC-like DNA-binding protein